MAEQHSLKPNSESLSEDHGLLQAELSSWSITPATNFYVDITPAMLSLSSSMVNASPECPNITTKEKVDNSTGFVKKNEFRGEIYLEHRRLEAGNKNTFERPSTAPTSKASFYSKIQSSTPTTKLKRVSSAKITSGKERTDELTSKLKVFMNEKAKKATVAWESYRIPNSTPNSQKQGLGKGVEHVEPVHKISHQKLRNLLKTQKRNREKSGAIGIKKQSRKSVSQKNKAGERKKRISRKKKKITVSSNPDISKAQPIERCSSPSQLRTIRLSVPTEEKNVLESRKYFPVSVACNINTRESLRRKKIRQVSKSKTSFPDSSFEILLERNDCRPSTFSPSLKIKSSKREKRNIQEKSQQKEKIVLELI